MRAIIIDDEPRAIELIKSYLNHFSQVELVATFRNGLKAFEFLSKEKVDIVFLDINMPHLSGMSLSKMIGSETKIIFTTAYAEYAVESYEVKAIDYLLKPISLERFTKAMSKVLNNPLDNDEHSRQMLFIKSGTKLHRVDAGEILYLQKEGNYMVYQLPEQKILARETIADSLLELPGTFFQVHKSYVVNILKIDFIDKDEISINNTMIPIGASFKHDVHEKLNGKSKN